MEAKRGAYAKTGVFIAALLFSSIVSASDLYRAQNTDGSFSYANARLDSRYTLYLEDDRRHAEKPARLSSSRYFSPALSLLIEHYAGKHQVNPDLVRAIAEVESAFNPFALSPKGAAGVMQLMPATAARYGVTQRTDPAQNIEAGVRYLKDLLALHNGNIALALAAYNAGEGAVARHGKRIPPYAETMLYVPAVLTRLQAYQSATSP